jgi:hypothetical protein
VSCQSSDAGNAISVSPPAARSTGCVNMIAISMSYPVLVELDTAVIRLDCVK